MRARDAASAIMGSALGRLILFGALAFAGFRIGMATPTALPYREHHPLWDTLGTSAFWLMIGLVPPLVVFIRASSLRWIIIGLACSPILAFLSGWGFRYVFTK